MSRERPPGYSPVMVIFILLLFPILTYRLGFLQLAAGADHTPAEMKRSASPAALPAKTMI